MNTRVEYVTNEPMNDSKSILKWKPVFFSIKRKKWGESECSEGWRSGGIRRKEKIKNK